MKLSFQIALRFLGSNKVQTIFIILGIGIGVSVQIFIGSLITGLQKSLLDSTIGSSSQITISSKDEGVLITDYPSLMSKVSETDDRIINISPALNNAAFLNVAEKSQSLLVRGFDFDKADAIYNISEQITEGSLPATNNEVLLGDSLKSKYDLKIGESITLITPDKRTVSCIIVGFFDLKVAVVNESWCVMSLSGAQAMFETGDAVTAIEMQLTEDEAFNADTVASKLSDSIGYDSLKVTNWKAQNESLLSGLQGQSISSLMIQIFVMISVLLGIASVLAITVMQKSKQIGILKAMGIKNVTASLIFLFEGLILGLFGAVAGILLGFGLLSSFSAFALNADGTPVVPLFIDPPFLILSGCIATLACLIAALIPAQRSSRLNPIDIIRNN